jgi:ATP-dependent exoDNAse (exonuclease V) beta subunit
LQNILGFEDEAGPAAVLGHIFHKVCEILTRASVLKHDKNSKIWDHNYLWKISYNHYANEKPHLIGKIQPAKLKRVKKALDELIVSAYSPIRDNSINSEIKFRNLEIKDPAFAIKRREDGTIKYYSLFGTIDRIDKINEDTIEIVDYKTGSSSFNSKDGSKKTPSKLHEDIQPSIYFLAARELFPWAKNFIITFIYIVDGGPISVPFCEDDVEHIKDKLRKRYKTIKANEDPQRDRSWKCKVLCNLGKSGVCDDVWREKNENGYQFTINKYKILHGK